MSQIDIQTTITPSNFPPCISSNGTVESDVPHTLLSYCRQVASGMTYLANLGFIHRDLATRNILISEDGTCKVLGTGRGEGGERAHFGSQSSSEAHMAYTYS